MNCLQCLETLKAILKLQQLRDETVSADLVNEESVVDTGKALYKFHIQLLLLLETANRMYSSLIVTSTQMRVSNDIRSQVNRNNNKFNFIIVTVGKCLRGGSPNQEVTDESARRVLGHERGWYVFSTVTIPRTE